jgi:NAD(P)-dependent dehydrogenase (short-subunit alcohol dehydrogenase family)
MILFRALQITMYPCYRSGRFQPERFTNVILHASNLIGKPVTAERSADEREYRLRITAIVTGGSRGLGRGVVQARELTNLDTVVADAADELTAGRLLQEKNPDLVVLCAGASALLRPLHHHSWESFSQNWEVDAKSAFVWLRNALLLPMKPGSHIVIVSSMAAFNGSPLSGSYAGAKRMLWFMADYAFQEINRLKLGIHIHCLLPTLNPNTDLGRAAIVAYAERAGVSIDEFAQRLTLHLTPAIMGDAVVELYSKPVQWGILGGAVRDGAGGTTRALCDRVLLKAYRHGNLRRDLHGRRLGVGALPAIFAWLARVLYSRFLGLQLARCPAGATPRGLCNTPASQRR